ncbi:MAG: FG-GAP repeat protein, partial [Anaerolineaceae bacterium]|nr:FG-GAP repeat protein [Anaerolineaceae bacterium]
SGSVWTEQAHLISSDGATEDYFGRAVALSSDGNTALIGADFKTINGNTRQGAAYIFTRAGAAWSQQTRLTDINGGGYSWFGTSVALSADGRTALVGADGTGAIVFTSSGDTWTQQTLLTIPDVPLSFGDDIAISADGRTALLEDGYTFRRCGNTWLEGMHLQTDEDPYPYGFGLAVSLSDDGTIALIGAPYATVGNNQKQGAAYFFPIETFPCPEISIYLPLIVR